jgi:hypothetical protein
MMQKAANQLATAITHFYKFHDDYSTDDANAISKATFLHLRSIVPEPEAAIVTEFHDGIPALLAVHENRLFVVTVAPLVDDNKQTAEAEQVVYQLDSKRCRLTAKAVRYGGSHTWGHTRRITWHLTAEDFEIEFTGHMDEDGVNDPKEDFARTLGTSLGWLFAEADQANLEVA